MVTKLDKYGEVDMVIGKKNRPGTWLVSPQDLNGFTDYKSMPLFNKPADIAFDSKDNIYIADGYETTGLLNLVLKEIIFWSGVHMEKKMVNFIFLMV